MILASLLATVTATGGPCASDLDCVLNGKCVSGHCACNPQWTSPNCGELNLLPAKLNSGYRSSNSTSWGGQIIEKDGQFSLFLAVMGHNCGLKSWTTNSFIARAVAAHPLGPYHIVDRNVRQVFAHNPTVFSVPVPASPHSNSDSTSNSNESTTWVLAQIGCGDGHGGKAPHICQNGSTPGVVPPTTFFDQEVDRETTGCSNCDNPHFSVAASAPHPGGPFDANLTELKVIPPPDWNASAGWHDYSRGISNPSFYVFENGSVLVAYSTGSRSKQNHAPVNKHIGVAFGESWRGPFVDLTPDFPVFRQHDQYDPQTDPWSARGGQSFNNSEDPHIFRDSNGYFHLLAHTGYANQPNWSHVSAHAYSTDAVSWHVGPTPPYTRHIVWESGETSEVFTRERPQLFFIDGEPAALINGVEPGNASMPFTPAGYTGDWSYTHIQAIAGSGI